MTAAGENLHAERVHSVLASQCGDAPYDGFDPTDPDLYGSRIIS